MNVTQLFSSIVFRLAVSVVILTIVIISLTFILQDVHFYLGTLRNGEWLQIVSFTLILVIGMVSLFFILVEKKVEAVESSEEPEFSSIIKLNASILGLKLIQGFLKGLSK